MEILRRFLVVTALLFWQGGFLFYSTVIIPIGRNVLDDIHQQAKITRQATAVLNIAGGVALLSFAWDLLAVRDPSPWRGRGRVILWLVLLVTLVVLIWLRAVLDQQFTGAAWVGTDQPRFSLGHRFYVAISTAQGISALIFLGLTLCGWKALDGRNLAKE
jgi:hypothetical protein